MEVVIFFIIFFGVNDARPVNGNKEEGVLKAQRYRILAEPEMVKPGNYLFLLIIHMRLLRSEKYI